MNKINFYQLSSDLTFKNLESSASGLGSAEASKRLEKNGYNRLPKQQAMTGLRLFLGQFKNPLVFILIFALAVSFFAGHGNDSIIILIVILITNTVGFLQEWKANNALKKLNNAVTHKVRVWRNGELTVIHREELVVGDVIELAAGDVVPADARIFIAKNLKINESSLTGESLNVEKNINEIAGSVPLGDRLNIAHQGTIIADGTGRAVVVAVGQNTEIGQVAKLIKETSDELTPLQKQINSFGLKLGLFLIIVNILIFVIGIIVGRDVFEMFMVSVVIVVSAVPEGLIPAMTIILAVGMQGLAKKQGLVRRAVAAETLGSVSVICADKTGTLTQGEMLIDKLISYGKIEKAGSRSLALKISVLCNDGLIEEELDEQGKILIAGNPTDKALLLSGANVGLYRKELEKLEPRLDVIPFSSDLKMMATLHESEVGGKIIYVKGAPEKILEAATSVEVDGVKKRLLKKDKEEFTKQIEKFTKAGERVIALAYRKNVKNTSLTAEDLNELTVVGFFSLRDQIRTDVKESIQSCREAGIRVVIITGDNANTAISIVQELGLEINKHNVLNGSDLDKLSDEELKAVVRNIRLYARVSPHHKLRIVKAFQEIGKVVAMTGDGINDSPALKKADIGVAVGNGTDVAKETADLVLLNNSFLTIVEAVKQGRITFNNIQKVVMYLFTDCFQEMVIIGTTVLMGWPLPILPVQVLWIKLIEDPLPAASLAFDNSDENVMSEKPRSKNNPILTGRLQKMIAFYATIMDIIALIIFYYYFKIIGNIDLARTVIFACLGFASLFYIYAVRSLNRPFLTTRTLSNKFLVYATLFGFLMIIISIYLPIFNRLLSTVPLMATDWLPIIAYGSLSIFVFEIGKNLFSAKQTHPQPLKTYQHTFPLSKKS